jgi:hypothetical protein
VIIHPGPQDTETMAGLYDSHLKSLMVLVEGYTDAELVLITEFIDRLIRLNQEQAGLD